MRLTATVALLCAVLWAVPGASAALALLRTEILSAPWQLLTAHFVHYSTVHALIDSAVLVLCTALAERAFGWGPTTVLILLGGVLLSLGALWLLPFMQEYRGASALATLLGVTVALRTAQQAPSRRPCIALLGLLLLATLLRDAWPQAHRPSSLPDGVFVAWPVYALAIALGMAATRFLPTRKIDITR